MTTSLIACHDITKAHGDTTLFDGITLTIQENDRLGMIGPNGAGKSTLLRTMAKADAPDDGEVIWRRGLRIAMVGQELVVDAKRSVGDVIAESAKRAGPLLALEDDTERHVRVVSILDRLGFVDRDQSVSSLSGGWLRRLAIASALVTSPDLLLLDEPTNHLDLEGIEWLEKHLNASRAALVVVSHDRAFLEVVAERVMELDRRYKGGFFLVNDRYSVFRERRAEQVATQAKEELSLASTVKREIEWLRRGPKARTHKSKGRTENANRLIEELALLRGRLSKQDQTIEFSSTGRRSKRLLLAVDLAKSLGGRQLFTDVTLLLRPGMRVGLVGNNGSGKTTLLRLLSGELEPDRGSVTCAEQLKVVYFDQQREQLDPRLTLRRTLAPDSDAVIFQGRSVHVVSWAKRFRFHSDQLDLPLDQLSGGEQAKAMIAKLLIQRADVLLLDEPTNDLDIPTLEVLEESLIEFPGAIVIVTHDRYVLDRVSTVLLALGGHAGESSVFADYDQWSTSREKERVSSRAARHKPPGQRRKRQNPRGLTYLEQQEYERIEDKILQAETQLEDAATALEDPAIAADAEKIDEAFRSHKESQEKVEQLYARWAELDEKLNR